jgi:hypothetical protein
MTGHRWRDPTATLAERNTWRAEIEARGAAQALSVARSTRCQIAVDHGLPCDACVGCAHECHDPKEAAE